MPPEIFQAENPLSGRTRMSMQKIVTAVTTVTTGTFPKENKGWLDNCIRARGMIDQPCNGIRR